MRILFLSQLVPYPPDSGPKVRAYYTLRYLAKKHTITLLALTRPDDKPEALNHLKKFCSSVYTIPIKRSRIQDIYSLVSSLIHHRPFVIERDYINSLAAKLDELISQTTFDAIHSDQLWMAQYVIRPQSKQGQIYNFKKILDEHNACFQIFKRLSECEKNPFKKLILAREWRALKHYETDTLIKFDQVVTVTRHDQGTLMSLLFEKEIIPKFSTIPICIDPDSSQPIQFTPNTKKILHLGTMFWLPNIEGVLWFAKEVLPLVLIAVPDASFTIVGKNPPKQIRQLAGNDRYPVYVTGYIAEPTEYLERAAVFIVPLLSGSGMRVKILDAWRWGIPVVSTSIGAEGIEYKDEENILIADTPQAFAQAVIRVLTNEAISKTLRINGRQWVEEHYDWQKIYPAWDAIYEK